MIGKLIGAMVGARAADRLKGVNEPTGALMGAATVALARRFGVMGLVATAAGGYALNRYSERRRAGVGPRAKPAPRAALSVRWSSRSSRTRSIRGRR